MREELKGYKQETEDRMTAIEKNVVEMKE